MMLAEKSHAREDFEPKLYRKRHKVQVRCVELTATISNPGPRERREWIWPDPSKEIRGFLSNESGIVLKDLAGLLLAAGSLTPTIERRYPLPGHRTRSGRRRKATFAQGRSLHLTT